MSSWHDDSCKSRVFVNGPWTALAECCTRASDVRSTQLTEHLRALNGARRAATVQLRRDGALEPGSDQYAEAGANRLDTIPTPRGAGSGPLDWQHRRSEA